MEIFDEQFGSSIFRNNEISRLNESQASFADNIELEKLSTLLCNGTICDNK